MTSPREVTADHLTDETMVARTNCFGLTFDEFWDAAQPADRAYYGHIRTRTRWSNQMLRERREILQYDLRIPLAPPTSKYVYGSKTRSATLVLRRAWQNGEDPTEWRAWAEKQLNARNTDRTQGGKGR